MRARTLAFWGGLFLHLINTIAHQVTHSLKYNNTMVTPGNHFTSVGLLDGEEFIFYDSNTGKMTLKTEWIKKLHTDSPYWQKEKLNVDTQKDWFKDRLQYLESTYQPKGVNTLQRVYGCNIDDNNATGGYDKSIYNGKEFIILNLDTGTWTAVDERAQRFTEDWNPEHKPASFWKNFLMETCVARLKSYMPYSTKKEPVGSDGGKTAITVVVVVVVVAVLAAAVGFVIYKKKLCARLRSGYDGASQSAEQ